MFDPDHQLDSEDRADLDHYAGPFWPLITVSILLALAIWSMS